ncbi:MAG: tRNA 2-selenouridine(34) synthase MnmH, partial [Bacteroidales bacterium]|nr:tRNA 2-selenouridine(34) synthase MnmH [Bacteroidales bacterium]
LFSIEVPVNIRIERLVGDYSRFDHAQLIQCMERIGKKIGGQHLNLAIASLEKNDYHTFAEIALNYYDKAYRFSLEKKAAADHIRISTDSGDPVVNARKIIHAAF